MTGRYVPNNRDVGQFMMTREGNPAAERTREIAHSIARRANTSALMWTSTPEQRMRYQRLRVDPRRLHKLAGSYKVARAVWVSKDGNPRASYSVYSNDPAAPFNEFGGGRNKTAPRPRHILRNAALSEIAQRAGASLGGW